MLKLLIADDEKVIRETISDLIDWEKSGIELIGTAKDGIEAYNIILDKYPDIVLTDIRMPGLSGLNLIQKIYDINKDTQFIILSGYNEFEYAKTAMQYGVRHYLLKPCSEEQIIESIEEVKEEYAKKLATNHIVEEHYLLQDQFNTGLIVNIINSYLAHEINELPDIEDEYFANYHKYLDRNNSRYDIFYLYYVEEHNFERANSLLFNFWKSHYPGIVLNILYVHNTMLFFFPSFTDSYELIEQFCNSLSFRRQNTNPVWEHCLSLDLKSALRKISMQIRRYEKIYYSNGRTVTTISNYNNIIKDIQDLTKNLFTADTVSAKSTLNLLKKNIESLNNLNFLKQIAPSIVMIAASKVSSFGVVDAAEFLLKLKNESNIYKCKKIISNKIDTLYASYNSFPSNGYISNKIKSYVKEHLSNSELSLKWIAEHELYMNVDYISKKFVKETGQKFSHYLTDVRIKKSKELLALADTDKIQNIAESVGFGNNPQYFSQIFKKNTGMSPSSYIKIIQSK